MALASVVLWIAFQLRAGSLPCKKAQAIPRVWSQVRGPSILIVMEAAKAAASPAALENRQSEEDGPVYCVFSERGKRGLVFTASMIAFLAPVSASIYYPALLPLSRDLHVSKTTVNLTITVYMVSPNPPSSCK